MAENLLRQILEKHRPQNYFKFPPKVFILVPANISDVEIELRESIVSSMGAREIQSVNSLLASAIGMGGDIGNEKGVMIVDIGGENIQCGIIKLNKIINSKSYDFGASVIDDEIIKKVRESYGVSIGLNTAEKLKRIVGLSKKNQKINVYGKNILNNIPVDVDIISDDIREIIEGFFAKIIKIIQDVFMDMPEEISVDIKDRGIMICGGGSKILNIKEEISNKLHLDVSAAKSEFVSLDGAKKIWKNIKNERIINYDE